MKIIIPMTGKSKRFREKGYSLPKQFLKIKDKLIIEHILDMYPGESDINFVVAKDDFENSELQKYFSKLEKYNIEVIDYQSSGPGGALLESKLLETDDEIFISYCDFANIWDWNNLKKNIIQEKPDGLLPVYKGLHPHSIYKNDYAFLKLKNNLVIDIKEKESFTTNKMEEPTSTGSYYFKSGKLAKKYIQKAFLDKKFVNNEIYISTVYEEMIRDKLIIKPYFVNYFFQWGTPEDYEEFTYCMEEIENINSSRKLDLKNINLAIPAAGESKRFKDENYSNSKIFLSLEKGSILENIVNSFSKQNSLNILIQSKDENLKKQEKINAEFTYVNRKTNGQAESALKLIEKIDNELPILVHSADCILDKNLNMNMGNADVVVFTKKNYRRSQLEKLQYGWVTSNEKQIFDIKIKQLPISLQSNIILGVFMFKNKTTFQSLYNKTISKYKGNNDLHIDFMIETAIENGLKVVENTSEKSMIIGTPVEYELYKYMNVSNKYLNKL